MSQKIYLFLAAITACSFVFFTLLFSPTEEVEKKSVSGAYESLSFLGATRSFPEADLPSKGYFDAFQSMRRNVDATSRDTDPWESLGPHNRAGRMLSLAINPQNSSTIWSGSASGGLWRSYSRGAGVNAWERVETGLPALAVSTIAFAPNDSTTMYIGTGEVYNYFAAGTGAAYRSTRGSFGMGVLKSTDSGATWSLILDWTANQQRGIWSIRVHPTDPNLIFIATTEGVYKSTNAGQDWEQILDVVMAHSLLVHPEDPDQMVAGCGNFATAGFGIYHTDDGGQNWTKKGDPLPNTFNGKILLALAPSQPNIIYASIGNGFGFNDGATWLCRSDDFGVTWDLRNTTDYSRWQGWFAHDVAVNPTNPDEIMTIGIDVWKSTDGGVNLVKKTFGGVGDDNPPIGGVGSSNTFVHSDCHAVIYDLENPNVLYIASDGGVNRSEDSGETFALANGRLQTVQFYNGFSNSSQDEDVFLGGLQDNGTNFNMGEKRWAVIFGGDGSWTAVNPQNDQMIFASYQNLRIQRSMDQGFFFDDVSPPASGPVAFIAPYVITPGVNASNVIMYAGGSAVWRSIDNGDNWEATNGGTALDGNPVLSMAVSQTEPAILYAATAPFNGSPSGVYVTQDGGDNWNNIGTTLPNAFPMDMAIDPTDDAVAYVTYSGFGQPHVYRTDDFGASWADISEALPDVPTNAVFVDPLFPNNVYVGNDLGVYVSGDYGKTWETYMEGLPQAIMVFDLTLSPINRKIRIASHGNGVFQRDLAEIELEPTATENLVLAEASVKVWPNPASERVALQFDLRAASKGQLEMVNNMGQTMHQQTQEFTEGINQLELRVNDYTAGIYYCRVVLENGEKMTQKVIVE